MAAYRSGVGSVDAQGRIVAAGSKGDNDLQAANLMSRTMPSLLPSDELSSSLPAGSAVRVAKHHKRARSVPAASRVVVDTHDAPSQAPWTDLPMVRVLPADWDRRPHVLSRGRAPIGRRSPPASQRSASVGAPEEPQFTGIDEDDYALPFPERAAETAARDRQTAFARTSASDGTFVVSACKPRKGNLKAEALRVDAFLDDVRRSLLADPHHSLPAPSPLDQRANSARPASVGVGADMLHQLSSHLPPTSPAARATNRSDAGVSGVPDTHVHALHVLLAATPPMVPPSSPLARKPPSPLPAASPRLVFGRPRTAEPAQSPRTPVDVRRRSSSGNTAASFASSAYRLGESWQRGRLARGEPKYPRCDGCVGDVDPTDDLVAQLPLGDTLGGMYKSIGTVRSRYQYRHPGNLSFNPGVHRLSPIHVDSIARQVGGAPFAKSQPAPALSPRVFEMWHAATVIQSFWRGVVARDQVWGPEGVNEHHQATIIAKTFRGMLGRRIVRKRRFEYHTRLAIRIQAVIRGRIARRKAAFLRFLKRQAACTLMQQAARRFLARKIAKRRRQQNWAKNALFLQRQARKILARRYVRLRKQKFARIREDAGVIARLARHSRMVMEELNSLSLGVEKAFMVAIRHMPDSHWLRRTGEYRPPSEYKEEVVADAWRPFSRAERIQRSLPSRQAAAVEQASDELPVEVVGVVEPAGAVVGPNPLQRAYSKLGWDSMFDADDDGADGDEIAVPEVDDISTPQETRLPQRATVRVGDDGDVRLDAGHGLPCPSDPWFVYRVLGPVAFWTPSKFTDIEAAGEPPPPEPTPRPLSRGSSHATLAVRPGSRQSMRPGSRPSTMRPGSRMSSRSGMSRLPPVPPSPKRPDTPMWLKPKDGEDGVVDYLSRRYAFRVTAMKGSWRAQMHRLRLTILTWLAIGLHAMSNDYRRAAEAYRLALMWSPNDPVLLTGYSVLLQAMDGSFEEAVWTMNKAMEIDPTGTQFKRIAAPYFLEAASRNQANIKACINAGIIMQMRLYLGAGLPRNQVRYTRRRAWLYFVRGLGGIAQPRTDSMSDDEYSLTDSDSDFDDDGGEMGFGGGSDNEEAGESKGADGRGDVERLPPSAATVSLVERLQDLRFRTSKDCALDNFNRLYEWYLGRPTPQPLATAVKTVAGGRHVVEVEAFVRGNYIIVSGRVNNARAHPLRQLGVSRREIEGGFEVSGMIVHADELDVDVAFEPPPMASLAYDRSLKVGMTPHFAPAPWSAEERDSIVAMLQRVVNGVRIMRKPLGGKNRALTRYSIELVSVRKDRSTKKAADNWANALQLAQSIARGFSTRNRFAVMRKAAAERRRQITYIVSKRKQRQDERLRKLMIVTRIQAMFRGLLARRRKRKEDAAAAVIQEWVRELLAAAHAREAARLSSNGLEVRKMFQGGRYVCGGYYVVTILRCGDNLMLHTVDPKTTREYHGLVLAKTWKDVVRRFPYGGPSVQRRAIAKTGKLLRLNPDNEEEVSKLLLEVLHLQRVIPGLGDLAREEGEFALILRPERIQAECDAIQAELAEREAALAAKMAMQEVADGAVAVDAEDDYSDSSDDEPRWGGVPDDESDESTDDEREFIDRHLHAPSRTMSQRNLDETRAIMRDTKSVARMYVREVQAGKVFKKRVIVSRGGRPAE